MEVKRKGCTQRWISLPTRESWQRSKGESCWNILENIRSSAWTQNLEAVVPESLSGMGNGGRREGASDWDKTETPPSFKLFFHVSTSWTGPNQRQGGKGEVTKQLVNCFITPQGSRAQESTLLFTIPFCLPDNLVVNFCEIPVILVLFVVLFAIIHRKVCQYIFDWESVFSGQLPSRVQSGKSPRH